MRCDDAQKALLAQRFGGTPLAPEVVVHLGQCPQCQAMAAQHAALERVFALDQAQPPRPGFDTQFFARLAAVKKAPTKARWWNNVWVYSAVAASLLAVVATTRLHRAPMAAEDIELALNLELLQEDLGMMRKLDDVEAYEVISKLTPEDTLP